MFSSEKWHGRKRFINHFIWAKISWIPVVQFCDRSVISQLLIQNSLLVSPGCTADFYRRLFRTAWSCEERGCQRLVGRSMKMLHRRQANEDFGQCRSFPLWDFRKFMAWDFRFQDFCYDHRMRRSLLMSLQKEKAERSSGEEWLGSAWVYMLYCAKY